MLDCLECNFVKRPFHRVFLLQAQESKSNGRPHITLHCRTGRFQPVGDLVIGERPTRRRSDGRDSIKDPALDLVDLQCDTSFLDWRGCRRKWRRSRDDWSLQEKLLETSWRLVHNGECLHKMRAPAESFWSIAVPHMFQMIELNAIELIYGSSIRISSITRTHFIVIILATIYKSICNGEYLLQR